MPAENQGNQEVIFGRNAVLAFLTKSAEDEADDKADVHKIFFSDGMRSDHRTDAIKRLAKEQGIPLVIVERRKLDRMVQSEMMEEVGHHQGVVAQISQVAVLELSDLIHQIERERETQESRPELLVVLDGIEDPHNLGAVIRVCEASGVRALLLPARRSAGVTGAVAKTSAGALAFLPVVRIHNIVRALEELKKANFWVAGLSADAKESHFEADLKRSLVVVLGNEGRGISRLVAEHCDFLLRIPMFGRTESLNASVAAGIVLYEFVRQTRISQKPQRISKNED